MVQGVRTKPGIVLASQKESKLGKLVCVYNEWKAANVNEDAKIGGRVTQLAVLVDPFSFGSSLACAVFYSFCTSMIRYLLATNLCPRTEEEEKR